MSNNKIRKALAKEAVEIHSLLGGFAQKGLLLPRSLSEIYDHLRDYFVVEDMETKGPIIAVCALGVCWGDLAEVRSLAVAEHYHGKGLGSLLVEKCLEEGRTLGLERAFALTYVPGFFAQMGFQEIDKAELPHKIWADCLKCPKFPDCDETAMIVNL